MNNDEINVERTVKKETIRWFVPAALGLVCLALIALSRVQVQGMLADYQTKAQAAQDATVAAAKFDSMQNQISVYAKQVADLQATLILMDKKLDHMQFALDYGRDNNRLNSPRQKDNP